jgi:hypothetical protein
LYDPKYDEPNYNPGGDYYGDGPQRGGSPAGPAIDLLKKYKLLIVIGIIGVVAIVLVMNFLNANQDVTINVKELGTTIPVSSNIRINDESGKLIKSFLSTESATINLPFGNYLLSVSSASTGAYKSITNQGFTVPINKDDSTETAFSVSLSKNITASLNILMDTTNLYGTNDINGVINIQNGNTPITDAKLVAFDTNGLVVEIEPDGTDNTSFSVQASGSTSFSFTVKMGKTPTSEKRLSLKFKIEGTNANTKSGTNGAEKDLIASPAVALTVSSSPSLDRLSAAAGGTKEITVTVTNTTKFSAEDVLVELVENEGSEISIDAFTFSDPYNGNKHQRMISSIAPKGATGGGDKVAVKLFFRPPSDALEGEKFTGKLILVSPSLSDFSPKEVVGNVSASIKGTLALTGIDSIVPVNFDDKTGEYPPKTMVVNLKNTGNADVADVVFGIEPVAPTDEWCIKWVSLDTADPITHLVDVGGIAKGAKSKDILMTINVDSTAQEGNYSICSFYWVGHVKDDTISVGDSTIVRISPKD